MRDLQRQEPLTKILRGVVGAARRTDRRTKPAILVKVSPDEDSREQVEGICEAVRDSGVDGVIVGNTTNRRPNPLPTGTKLSETEAAIMLEQGGYSGPQLFERAVNLVKRYRRILDRSLDHRWLAASQRNDIQSHSREEGYNIIEASIDRDTSNLKTSDDASTQPLIHLPECHISSSTDGSDTSGAHALSISNYNEQSSYADTVVPSPARDPVRKVIFCSEGITNGRQALEVLNAGADLVQIYTA